MSSFQEFLAERLQDGSFSTEDVLASGLPLLRQVVETHASGLCAPLYGIDRLHVDGVSIWYENAHRVSPVSQLRRIRKLDRARGGAIEVVREHRRKTRVEEGEVAVTDLAIGAPDDDIARPVYLPGFVAWEHRLDHHDPLVDVFSAGMILASLACGLNLGDVDDLRTFVAHRGNLFALNPRLHPVVARAIVAMTELSRHRRPQDLAAVLRTLENHRDQEVDLDLELARVEDFERRDGLAKQRIILTRLQERLFEISRRNRLLHFRPTMQTLNLTNASVPLSFDIEHIRPDQVLTWHGTFRNEVIAGKAVSLSKYLDFREVLYLPGTMDRIRAESRRDYAEFGFEQMRLAVCFLRWANLKEEPPEAYDSPLVLLPVRLQKKKGVRDTWFLEPLSDEAEINPVLRHLFKQLYDIDLPETVTLTDDRLDELHADLVAQIQASEPGVTLAKIDRPRIDLIHDQARRRLDRYCRRARLSGRGVRRFHDIDYSYDPANYHPLGLQLFNAMVRPGRTQLAAIVEQRPRPRTHVAPEAAPIASRQRQFYALREDDNGNPFAWEYDLCRVTLGNFRYRKMTLVRDYADLLRDGRTNPAFDASFSLSPRPDPSPEAAAPPLEERIHVVPCDPTQAGAVARAQSGESYIIQGPPGTGKSQTITNLIADYVMRGKRVLFVCEKRAAIDVVYHRLRQLGLHALCCLIHDSQADKKSFVMDLKQTYETFLDESARGRGHTGARKRLIRIIRDELQPLERFNDAMLEAPDQAGASTRDVLDRAIHLANRRPTLTPIEQERLPPYRTWVEHRSRLSAVDDIIRDIQTDGIFSRHPLRRLHPDVRHAERPLELLTTHLDTARQALQRLIGMLRDQSIDEALWPNLDGAAALMGYVGRIHELAQRNLCNILNDLGEAGRRYASRIEDYERSLGALDEKQKATANWRERIPPDEIEIALEQARAFERDWLRLLKPDWWRLRGVIRKRYDFAAHAVRPSWVRVLTALREEYEEETTVRETARTIAQDLELDDDLDRVIRSVHAVNRHIRQAEAPLQAFHRDLVQSSRADERVLRMAAARGEYETITSALESCLDGFGEPSLPQLEVDLDETHAALDELPEYLSCLTHLVELPESLRQALGDLPLTVAQIEAAMAGATADEICRTRRELSRFTSAARRRHVQRLEVLYEGWLEGNARVVHDAVRRQFLECIRTCSLTAAELTSEQKTFKKRFNRGRRELEHEFAKSMRYRSVRDLVAGDTGMVVQVLKPVWLMSPLSVSDALPLDGESYDVVIFDEASQITLEEAVPSIFRARQAIVVGDEMQLPPTNFFSAKQSEDEESVRIEEDGEVVDYDLAGNSFLNHAARNLSSQLLGWHYRSRSESLISFSNWAFYQGRLLTVPEEQFAVAEQNEIRATTADAGRGHVAALRSRPISFHFMDEGVYHKRRNRMEADYIAHLVHELLMGDTGMSIGIVAFSEAQQGEIESALERLGRSDNLFRDRLETEIEREEDGQFIGLLVKNLENIQGDERDIVIMSICYGHNPDGRMLMNFGPINQSGGEKRLNVAFSRAKHHMAIVSSIRHTDITNEYNDGASCLKSYLHYADASSRGDAATARRVLGELAVWREDDATSAPKESPVARAIAQALRDRGHAVDLNVGMSHFRCDLAVRSGTDSRYDLGILVDSRSYYEQSDLLERDMMKPRLLRHFGWRVTHVLSKEWFMDPDAVLQRLEARIAGAEEEGHVDTAQLEADLERIYEEAAQAVDEEEKEKDAEAEAEAEQTHAEPEAAGAADGQAEVQEGEPSSADTRYFELSDDKSSKYWQITLSGSAYTVRFGRLGSKGQSRTKSFRNPPVAEEAMRKAIQQKLKKGYREKPRSG